jgi:hypothetical protein
VSRETDKYSATSSIDPHLVIPVLLRSQR